MSGTAPVKVIAVQVSHVAVSLSRDVPATGAASRQEPAIQRTKGCAASRRLLSRPATARLISGALGCMMMSVCSNWSVTFSAPSFHLETLWLILCKIIGEISMNR